MPKPHPAQDLIDSRQACELLGGIHRSTLSRWVTSGRINPAVRFGGNDAYLFRRSDVEALAKDTAA